MGMGNNGAGDAAKAMEEGARNAQQKYQEYAQKGVDYTQGQGQQGRSDLEQYYKEGQGYIDPYQKAGKNALDFYMGGLGLNPNIDQNSVYEAFQKTPGYQAALDEGRKGIERRAAATGHSQGGAVQKELMRYGQDYASQKYGDFMNRVGQMAGMGADMSRTATGNANQMGSNLSNQGLSLAQIMAQLYGGMGENAANAELAASNARAQAAMNQGGGIGDWLGPIGSIAGSFLGPAGGEVGKAAGSAIANKYFN